MTAPKTSMKPAKTIARKRATAVRKAANATKARKKRVLSKNRVNFKRHVPAVKPPGTKSLVKKIKKKLTPE